MRLVALVAVLFSGWVGGSALADEGMWLYNRLPVKQLKEKYGFEPTPAWSEHLMKSSVRFNNGGSGSFVSSNGLVLTNHHVAADTLYKVSSQANDYLRDGFLAHSYADEIKAPDLELNQLVSIQDVTTEVNGAVKSGMSEADAAAARRTVIAKIEKESLDTTGLRSNVITLFKGGAYHLYRYKKYTDVRVVFAPEVAIAFFGGDPDNFEYPRYCLDMTLMRVYEDGKPANIANHLKWSKDGAGDGELVFVSGNPGRTNRIYTTEALAFLRDQAFPFSLKMLRHREILLQLYAQESDEKKRRAKDALFGIQNSRKAYMGMLQGLQDPAFLAAKQREEYQLRVAVASDPKLKEYDGAWDRINEAQKAHKKLLVGYNLFERGRAFDSQLFRFARTLVRMAQEDRKPDGDRLPEYQSGNRASLEQDLFSTAPLYTDLEMATLKGSLSFMVEMLGEQDRAVQQVLQGRSPHGLAEDLVTRTTLLDPQVRKFLAAGGWKRIQKSYDPLIRFALQVDRLSRRVRQQFEDQVEEPERQAYGQIARALFALQGDSVYPDATFTLRLAYGVVKGYRDNGASIPPWTEMGGAFDKETSKHQQTPWKLPDSWHKAASKIQTSTPFNFVSTTDIVGGNSGSPVVNQKGELVGLIFDGNRHSLTFNYAYSEEKARSVSVHSSGMREALVNIYGADFLMDQIEK